MTTIGDLFPLLSLRVQAGPLELRGLGDEDLVTLAGLAAEGIHDEDAMPFQVPWTLAPKETFELGFLQYHWRTRADFSPAQWVMNLGVWHDGDLVGVQGFDTSNYLVTRTGETGSWLGRRYQGRGIGTAMRQAICAFIFDHLDAEEITSGAFLDNPASRAVSRKVGYRDNGRTRMKRRDGELAINQSLVLSPEDLVRGKHELQVDGLSAFRRSIGLDEA